MPAASNRPAINWSRADLAGHSFRAARLAGATFAQSDLRGADFCGADLSGACFDDATLEGAHLEKATLSAATFSGVSIATLLSCGIRPRDLLAQRAVADPRCFPRLLFGPLDSNARYCVTAREATYLCQASKSLAWESLTTLHAFGVLFPAQPWHDWVLRCRSRRVLDWALRQGALLDEPPARPFPHFGRVPPARLLDEVGDDDLAAGGLATNSEHLFTAIGTRRLLRQQPAASPDVGYPPDPFRPFAGISYISSTLALEAEAALMGHCVDMYDEECQSGESFIYHVGATAPEGSTLQVTPDGEIVQHYARFNADPNPGDRALVKAWCEHQRVSPSPRQEERQARPIAAAPAAADNPLTLTWRALAAAGIAIIRCQISMGEHEVEVSVLEIDGAEVIPASVSPADLVQLITQAGFEEGRVQLRIDRRQILPLGPRAVRASYP